MPFFVKSFLVMVLLAGSTSSWGALYRLDFGGQDSNGSVSGYFILDYSAPDVNPDPEVGLYPDLVVARDIVFNGVHFLESFAAPLNAVVNRDDMGIGDVFGLGGGVTNSDGDRGFFAIQFLDSSGTVFSSDALPTSLDLADFDLFNPANTSSTGMLVSFGFEPLEFIPLDFMEFRQVPVPAAGWLFLSAVVVCFRTKWGYREGTD